MFTTDIIDIAKNNTYFRKVLHTGEHSQLVVMSIPVGGDIGLETHPHVDQILYFVEGKCTVVIDNETREVATNDIVFVPAGAQHNFTNSGDDDLKLFTVYSPPEHADGTIHETQADAQKAEQDEK